MPGKRTDYDLEEIRFLASIMCTVDEIAAWYKVATETVKSWIKRYPEVREAIEQGRQEGKASLKRAMFRSAMDGDTRMQIWLSKQYLGHRDAMHINYEADLRKMNRMTTGELLRHMEELTEALKETTELDALPLDDAVIDVPAIEAPKH